MGAAGSAVRSARPVDEPLSYTLGGWPHGEVRPLNAEEGGELVRWQVEQLRLFVTELIERREARGVTQATLTELTGLRRNTVSELEAGRSFPDWSTIARIGYALDADVRFVPRRSERVEPTPVR